MGSRFSLIGVVLINADVLPKEGEVENTYKLLTSDDITSGSRTETRNELEQDGVPIEKV